MSRPIAQITPTTSDNLRTPYIFTATVVSVNTEEYTMVVRSNSMGGLSGRIEVPSTYTNVRGGNGGIHFLPEVGAEVWLCKTSDGGYVPLAYHNVIGDSGYKGNRPDMLPGDICISTNDGNSITVGKGGSIALTASPVCSMLLDPIDDAVVTFSSEIKSYSLAYTAEYLCDVGRNTSSIERYFVKAEDNDPCVEVIAGYTGYGAVYVFTANQYEDDALVSYEINKDGSVSYETKAITSENTEVEITTTTFHHIATDVHVEPELMTVGTKDNSDFLLKREEFLADIVSMLVDISGGLAATGAPTAASLATKLAEMQTKIASGVYYTNKLKSE